MISTKQNGYQPVRNGDEDFTPPKTGSNVGFERFRKWELIRLCKRYHKNIYRLVGQKMILKDRCRELELQLNREKNLNKVLEDNNEQLRELIEKMKADVKQEQSYWNSGEMPYGLFQRLLDKWEVRENDRRRNQSNRNAY